MVAKSSRWSPKRAHSRAMPSWKDRKMGNRLYRRQDHWLARQIRRNYSVKGCFIFKAYNFLSDDGEIENQKQIVVIHNTTPTWWRNLQSDVKIRILNKGHGWHDLYPNEVKAVRAASQLLHLPHRLNEWLDAAPQGKNDNYPSSWWNFKNMRWHSWNSTFWTTFRNKTSSKPLSIIAKVKKFLFQKNPLLYKLRIFI